MGKKNHLLEAIIGHVKELPKGRVLDLGCGDGDYAHRLHKEGFDVVAGDIHKERFRYHEKIAFKHCDILATLPFPDGEFDYVLLLEVVEHLRSPYDVLREISRVIKPGGALILSTPNILSLKSRLRFFVEGTYEYFREPPLDQVHNPKEVIFNLHIVPYRYHELEYLLGASGFEIKTIFTSVKEWFVLGLFYPLLWLQAVLKEMRCSSKEGVDYRRIHKVVLSSDLIYGRHLILRAKKG